MTKITEAQINKVIEKLFHLNAHLGHKKNRLHPRAKKFVYQIIDGTTIIDLVKTVELLEKAKEFLKKLAKENKKIVVVATKKNLSALIKKICQKNNISYLTNKWPAGFLTNFNTLLKNIKKLKKMNEEKQTGQWSQFVKHEQVKLNKILNRLTRLYDGVVNLEKIPDALVIVDSKKEKTALKEACRMRIPVIAIVDTNINPDPISYPIPANDDSLEAVEYLINELISSYQTKKND